MSIGTLVSVFAIGNSEQQDSLGARQHSTLFTASMECGGPSDAPAEPRRGQDVLDGKICMKCKEQSAQVLARQGEPLCLECLCAQVQSKAQAAVRSRCLLAVGDSVMLAFSGGAASAALLHLLAGMRNPRQDRLERKKVAFKLHVVHIDEAAAFGATEQEAAEQRSAVAAAAQYLSEGVQYHCVPLEEVFGAEESDPLAQRQRLRELVQEGVSDPTGREDLVEHLRTHMLLSTARQLGCCKVARGDCATRLAAHIVAAAAKGCGYGLPGDVQLVDARYGPGQPLFFYPLREIGRAELEHLCCHRQLPTVATLTRAGNGAAGAGSGTPCSGRSSSSINSLAAGFVDNLLAHNPGSVSNILGTISKLQAFPWNDPPELQHRPGERRAKGQQSTAAAIATAAAVGTGVSGATVPEAQQQQQRQDVLCPLCLAPLADDELAALAQASAADAAAARALASSSRGASGEAPTTPPPACCFSCRGQILGLGPETDVAAGACSSAASSLLPAGLRQQMQRLARAEARAAVASGAEQPQRGAGSVAAAEQLRAQIAEFLLED